ncbi:hypothetical protein TD95_004867 [Thielaviopsis punctulata]|uniref:Uncharacterized protein n=1 Tax=Thielaviopsis punctulata TaxID=72032 RepID=A0A0F4ZMV1_9PEZI|nr:hypothetical protein TD95_004867 [Thielaviopsis punctulata]
MDDDSHAQDSSFGESCYYHMVVNEDSDEIEYTMTSAPMYEEDGVIPIYSTHPHAHNSPGAASDQSSAAHSSPNPDNDDPNINSHDSNTGPIHEPHHALYNMSSTNEAHVYSSGQNYPPQTLEDTHHFQVHPMSNAPTDPEFISPPITPQASVAPIPPQPHIQSQPLAPFPAPPHGMIPVVNPGYLNLQNLQPFNHIFTIPGLLGQMPYPGQSLYPSVPPFPLFPSSQGQNSTSVPTYFANPVLASQHLGAGDLHLPGVLIAPQPALLGPENPDFITFLRIWNTMRHGLRPSTSHIRTMLKETAHRKVIEAKDINDLTCDVQGINWNTLGVTRKEARFKRQVFYRNYTNCGRSSEMAPGYDDVCLPSSDKFYRFRVNHIRQNVHLSHFQLRNMLATPSRYRIYYPDKSGIRELNTFDGTDKLILDTGPITEEALSTMTANHGMLVAGTFSGKYQLRRIDSGSKEFHDGHITTNSSGITNHVQVYMPRTSSNPVAGFCSNDSVFRALDLATEKFTHSFEYSCAINSSAISPDGRLRVIVGDSKSVLIADAESGEILQRLDGHRDYGFACDWAGDGWTVATGFQDMGIKIWDARRWRDINGNATPVTTIRSELSGVRSLRFTPVGSGLRALVAAEEADFVNIIDGRSFQSKQTFDVFGEIGGISFADDAHELNILCSDTYKGGIIQLDRCQYGVDSTRWQPIAPVEEMFNSQVMKSTPLWRKTRPRAMRPCIGSDWDDLEDTEVKQSLRARGLVPKSQRSRRAIEAMFGMEMI